METLAIIGDGDNAWPDLQAKAEAGELIEIRGGQIAGLAGGMASGRPSVALRLDLPDGRVVVFQTSLALLLSAADVLKARHGDPREGRP